MHLNLMHLTHEYVEFNSTVYNQQLNLKRIWTWTEPEAELKLNWTWTEFERNQQNTWMPEACLFGCDCNQWIGNIQNGGVLT